VEEVIRFALLGLGIGATYALASQGLIIVYRGSGVLNFALGAIGMAGAYVWWELNTNQGWAFLPALIAGVIYAETKFDPRPSSAGALGLMQILPSTAQYIAHLSGGTAFTTGDLATPKINVAYGSWYLRYLLDHYEGNEMLAVAAYNGGLANVDAWVAKAREAGKTLSVSEIPFPETQAYVQKVMRAQAEYRAVYPRQLGL